MTIEPIDTTVFMLPSSRASQAGVGTSRSLMVANKVNEIIEGFGSMATIASIVAINTQVSAILQGLDVFYAQIASQNSAFESALISLSKRVGAMEFESADAIPNVSTDGVNISLMNLATLQALNTQGINQGNALNKILAVMRTRKEIKT